MLTNQHLSAIIILTFTCKSAAPRQAYPLGSLLPEINSTDIYEALMIERFENLTTGVARIYKCIQKIKKHQMSQFGMKGTHVMCIHYLDHHPEGLTAARLCKLCGEDKAAISRILADLEKQRLIFYDSRKTKKYRTNALLTDSGKAYARKIQELILHATMQGGQDINEEEREIFYRVLNQIAGNLEQICLELSATTETRKDPFLL